MDKFYDYLREMGILEAPDVADIISKLKTEEILDFAMECYLLTETNSHPEKNEGVFNFSVSSSVSGGITPCSNPLCRINNSYDLASFAALYSERIYIPNPFEHVHRRSENNFNFDNEEQFFNFVNQIIGDVMVLLTFRPLFNHNIFSINPQMVVTCRDCWNKKRKEQKDIDNKFKESSERIIKKINENVTFKIDETGSIVISGTENYIGGEVLRFITTPENLKKYHKKKPYVFSENEVKSLRLYEYFMNSAMDDIMVQKFFIDDFNTSYLTNRGIDSDILQSLIDSQEQEKRKQEYSTINGLSHTLPFVQDSTLENLLDVRESEQESFKVYRDAIRMAIKDAKNTDTTKLVEQIKSDVIEPALNKIELQIKNNRGKFKTRLRGKLQFNSLLLAGGLFANSFFGLDKETILAFGGIHTLKEFIADKKEMKNIPNEVKNNDYYFIWKLKN